MATEDRPGLFVVSRRVSPCHMLLPLVSSIKESVIDLRDLHYARYTATNRQRRATDNISSVQPMFTAAWAIYRPCVCWQLRFARRPHAPSLPDTRPAWRRSTKSTVDLEIATSGSIKACFFFQHYGLDHVICAICGVLHHAKQGTFVAFSIGPLRRGQSAKTNLDRRRSQQLELRH